jgi:predicted Zn-dependent protease
MWNRGWIILALVFVVACVTSPLGRKQLMLVPDAQMDAMGTQAFKEMKAKTKIENDPAWNRYVRCVALPITDVAKGKTSASSWEIVVFEDTTANAFALPGGKIGVHTGLFKVAKSDGQLAAVLGHEVGHVIANHGGERVSEAIAAQGGLALVNVFLSGKASDSQRQLLMGALGLGAQVGVLLPHSRTQESEADLVGLDLMSRAGFDPRESVALWRNMIAESKGAPPEWLSTHPAGESRIQSLEAHMSEAMPNYQSARDLGRVPQCVRP